MFKTTYFICILFVAHFAKGYRTIKDDGVQKIFSKEQEETEIVCENGLPLARCGYTHPNGTQMFFHNLLPGTPECKLTVIVTNKEEGLWKCHLWPQNSPQEETTKAIEVRIVKKFAAVSKEVKVKRGDGVTLLCVTAEKMVPLTMCHFTTPHLKDINLVDDIISENAIEKRYFFPKSKSLYRGDCGITITSATASDSGAWRCNGWIEYDNTEYRDNINLIVEELNESTTFPDVEYEQPGPITISVTVYVCSIAGLLILFASLVYCRYKYYSKFYGAPWTDVESIDSYTIKNELSRTSIVVPGSEYMNFH